MVLKSIDINEDRISFSYETDPHRASNQLVEVELPWNEVLAIANWRTMVFDDDTNILFIFSRRGGRYAFDTNKLRASYREFLLQYETFFGLKFEAFYSSPTVVYPKVVYGCPLFASNWWFKINWNLFMSHDRRVAPKISRCVRI